jgi:hypothetical protein
MRYEFYFQILYKIRESIKFTVPVKPKQSQMITVNSTVLTIWLDSWGDGGCPVLYFIVEYRDMHRPNDWLLVSNNVQPLERAYSILDLVPATKYHLRVTAHNNAGSTVAFYNFTTLTAEGGNISFDAWLTHRFSKVTPL